MSKDNINKHKRKRSSGWKVACIFLILIVLALAFVIVWPHVSQGATENPEISPEQTEVEATPVPETHVISFFIYDQKPIVMEIEKGKEFDVPDGPDIPGYTFLAWLDADGKPLKEKTLIADTDLVFQASCAIAFQDDSTAEVHEPYMSLSENSMFHPDEPITRGEFISILYELLDFDKVGSGYFADVSTDDVCYTAAATLKDLGLISGERLHPEDPVTYGELFRVLEKMFPAPVENHEFEQVAATSEYFSGFRVAVERGWLKDMAISPYDNVSRYETARIFNLLTHRDGVAHDDLSMTGTVLDVQSNDERFPDIMEAVIAHHCKYEDGEVWTESTPLEIKSEGRFFTGLELRCIKADGNPAIDETVDGLYYDANGIESTGNAELDSLVRKKLTELVNPSQMQPEEMLKILYDFVRDDSFYLRGDFYEVGQTGWEADEAYKMLSTGKGNCYSYAATFWALARGIGYDAVCYSGTVGTHDNPHGWVEITMNETPYIFDPTLEYEQWYGPGTHTFERFFKKPYESVSGWLYSRT